MDLRIALLSVAAFIGMYMAVLLLIVTLQKKKVLKKDPEPGYYPPVTIVVPAWNEEDTIEDSVKSLLALEYLGKLEILVVNDGSTDGTGKILEKYEKKGLIKVLSKENGGKASSMNAALKVIKTEFFACMDADSIAEKDALNYMMGYLQYPKVGAVTAALKVRSPKSFFQKVQKIEYLMNLLQRKLFTLLNVLYVTPGPLSVYRTDLVRKIGGFDETNLTEDMEIALRIQDKGYRIENSTNANVYTDSPVSLYSLLNQRVRWYRGFVQNMRKYRHMFFSRSHGLLGMLILPATVLMIVVSFVAAALLIYTLAEILWDALRYVYYVLSIGFATDFKFDILQLLFAQNLFVLVITGAVLLMTLFLVYVSHRVSNEKFSFSMKIAYAFYIFLYSVLVASVWVVSVATELLKAPKKISKW